VRRRCSFIFCVLLLVSPSASSAQSSIQLWANLTFDWVRSDRLVYELDFEPKVQVHATEDEPAWRNLDVTPNVEYSPRGWLDLVAEATAGFTRQSDDVNTIELTPRVGVRFHVFSREPLVLRVVAREHRPKRRIVIRDLVRIEARNFFYTEEGEESSSTLRFRNRLELLFPLNRERLTEDGVRYLIADWEWFIPLDDPEERFASRQRIRVGLGYRRNFPLRVEALYIWTRSRNTLDEEFRTNENSFNIRVKRVF
jgi:hypothetical protein